MVKLVTDPYDSVCYKIDYMMGHEEGIKEIFYHKRERLNSSVVASLIMKNDKEIGFLNVVKENIDDILFVDGGIIKQYRGKGYGSEALEIIKSIPFSQFLICETKNTNVLGNSSAYKIGELVFSCNDKNYYLLQKERISEFLNSKAFTELQGSSKIKRLTK